MKKELFEDLISACHEAIAHEKGDIKLNSNTVTMFDEEIEANQLLYQKIQRLSGSKKDKAVRYVDELLQA